jgi:hypothetical protein
MTEVLSNLKEVVEFIERICKNPQLSLHIAVSDWVLSLYHYEQGKDECCHFSDPSHFSKARKMIKAHAYWEGRNKDTVI